MIQTSLHHRLAFPQIIAVMCPSMPPTTCRLWPRLCHRRLLQCRRFILINKVVWCNRIPTPCRRGSLGTTSLYPSIEEAFHYARRIGTLFLSLTLVRMGGAFHQKYPVFVSLEIGLQPRILGNKNTRKNLCLNTYVCNIVIDSKQVHFRRGFCTMA